MADTDIYGRFSNSFGGAFAADSAKLTFADGVNNLVGAGGVGLLTQQLSFSYNQAISRLYELGSNNAFYVAGRTQGSISIGRVLGPRPVSLAFYKKYGSVCHASTNNLNLSMATECEPSAAKPDYGWKLLFCVITSIAVSVNAQDMLVNEQLQLMFASLNLGGGDQTRLPNDTTLTAFGFNGTAQG